MRSVTCFFNFLKNFLKLLKKYGFFEKFAFLKSLLKMDIKLYVLIIKISMLLKCETSPVFSTF